MAPDTEQATSALLNGTAHATQLQKKLQSSAHNLAKKNIVMVQYKMLEPNGRVGEPTDWLYRPDTKMADEVRRMRAFASTHAAGPLEYRLNPEVF